MARKKQDPITHLVYIHSTAIAVTGAFAALLLVVLIPALQPYRKWIMLGGALLGIALGYLWIKRTVEFPVWYFPALVWVAVGNVLFFLSPLVQNILEIWFDLTPYQMTIDLVSLACPVVLGAIGALKHKDDNLEEDHNNG